MARPKTIVIVQQGRDAPPVERLHDEADISVVRTRAEFEEHLPGADILFLNDFRSTLLKDVGPGDLKWIHTSSIGVDVLLTPEIVGSDIIVTNSRGVCERPIAEWILGVILMFLKDLRRTIELQQSTVWRHRETESLLGRRVLVLGPGPVGVETTLLLRAAGMDVKVVGRSRRDDPRIGTIESIDDLDRLLGEANDVVVTLPLTAQTRDLFDAKRFASMKPGARFINVGRGAVVVDDDLLNAIDSGQVSAAALDVFRSEPLRPDHEFWSRPNILVSPHASGDLVGWRSRVVDLFAANLRRWKSGIPLQDVVDLARLGVDAPGASDSPI